MPVAAIAAVLLVGILPFCISADLPEAGTLLVQTGPTARVDRAADSSTRVSTFDLLARSDTPWLGGPTAMLVGTTANGTQVIIDLQISGAQALLQGAGAAYDGDLLPGAPVARSQVSESQLQPLRTAGTVLTPSTLSTRLDLSNPTLYLDLGPDVTV